MSLYSQQFRQKSFGVEAGSGKRWKVPVPLTGHGFFYGRVGGGKSCKMLTLAQGYHSEGYKIWDLFGKPSRVEGPFWTMPNDDHKLWKAFQDEEGNSLSCPGPKQYKVNLLYPMWKSNLKEYLPEGEPHVKSKVFTIPIRDIDIEDAMAVVGDTGTESKLLWQEIMTRLTRASHPLEIQTILDNLHEKHSNSKLWVLFFKPLIDAQLLAPHACELNLDIIGEAKDRETISVLMMDQIPKEFRFFVLNYLLRKISMYLGSDDIPKKNIGLFREVSEFMKLQDSSDSVKGSPKQCFRNQFFGFARMCRDGLFFFCDTQSPEECAGLLDGQSDMTVICEMQSVADQAYLCDPLIKTRVMHPSHKVALSRLPIEKMIVIARGDRARLLHLVAPPRTRYWKQDKGSFYTIWDREVNKWRSTETELKITQQLFDDAKEKIALKMAAAEVRRERMQTPSDPTTEQQTETAEPQPAVQYVRIPQRSPRRQSMAGKRKMDEERKARIKANLAAALKKYTYGNVWNAELKRWTRPDGTPLGTFKTTPEEAAV